MTDVAVAPRPSTRSVAMALVLAAAASLAGAAASAHGERQVRYADATTGLDAGSCTDPHNPCRTLDYARNRAAKGDRVCLADGIYRVDYSSDAMIQLKLFNPLIEVHGPCDAEGNPVAFGAGRGRPTIEGVPERYRQRLAERGLGWASADRQPASALDATPSPPADEIAQAASTPRYVDSVDGVDDSDCAAAARPCKTVQYARSRADPGDAIVIAAGTYEVAPDEVGILLGDEIIVRDRFPDVVPLIEPAPRARPTYVIGPTYKHRAALAARGFTLLQDRKALDVPRTVEERDDRVPPNPPQPGPVACTNGTAGPYPCDGVDYLSRVALHQFSSNPAAGNDIWGFVDLGDGREYAIIGLTNGTAVVDVTAPTAPRLVDAVDATDPADPLLTGDVVPGDLAIWRDIKVYQVFDEVAGRHEAYAFVTADGPENGEGQLQIIDLSDLPDRVVLVKQQSNFSAAHNVYISNIDYATGAALSAAIDPFLYILGANIPPPDPDASETLDQAYGAFRIYAIAGDPTMPLEVTPPPPGTFYAHDAVTLLVDDDRTQACTPDGGATPAHNPCEILVDYNENTVDIWDVTDKSDPIKLSSVSYPDPQYTHSGWPTLNSQHVFVHDEYDEKDLGVNTTLRVFSIADLRNPGTVTVAWTGPTKAVDHNGFTKGDRYYISNYLRGLTVLDISDPESAIQVGFFDTAPEIDEADHYGAWGVYPYLPSGTIVVSDIDRGLFVLQLSAE